MKEGFLWFLVISFWVPRSNTQGHDNQTEHPCSCMFMQCCLATRCQHNNTSASIVQLQKPLRTRIRGLQPTGFVAWQSCLRAPKMVAIVGGFSGGFPTIPFSNAKRSARAGKRDQIKFAKTVRWWGLEGPCPHRIIMMVPQNRSKLMIVLREPIRRAHNVSASVLLHEGM